MTKAKVSWLRVERIIRRSVNVGGDLGDDQDILYQALAEDAERYRKLHARVKREEGEKLWNWR